MAEKPDNAEPLRRWYQFGLRTLLIGVGLLAVPCAYVGWQANIVRERKSMLKGPGVYGEWRLAPDVSWIRKLLGDTGYSGVFVPLDTTTDELERFKIAFPEADVDFRRPSIPPEH